MVSVVFLRRLQRFWWRCAQPATVLLCSSVRGKERWPSADTPVKPMATIPTLLTGFILAASILFVQVPSYPASHDVRVGQFFWVRPTAREAFEKALVDWSARGEKFIDDLGESPRFQVIVVEGARARIRFDDGSEGWILRVLFDNSSIILYEDPRATRERARVQREKEAENRRAAEAKARASERARRDAEINVKPWPGDIKALVRAGQIKKGMTPEMVRLALGQPTRVIETDVGPIRHEQWMYPGGTYLFFENDVLVGWQRER